MNVFHFKKENIIPGVWDGGKTYEYCIFPPQSQYAERNFDFRISSASIEKSPSNFTQFEAYTRFLIMLDGRLEIIRNGKTEVFECNELFQFDSADEIQSFSIGNDFNWMVRTDKFESKMIFDFTLHSNFYFQFVFALTPTEVLVEEKTYFLDAFDLLVIENPERKRLAIQSAQKNWLGQAEEKRIN